jgi:DUF1365 family protein
MTRVQHIAGQTFHGRKGAVENRFRYGIDYVLLDAETPGKAPRLFGRNRGRLMSLWDVDHGGPPKQGEGAAWVRRVLSEQGLPAPARIDLLAQPRILGHVFNPVSFWLCHDEQGALRVVLAEVTNTYGDRHSYLCHRPDHAPITREDTLTASKLLHVSPFQPIAGGYQFRFDIRPDKIHIVIDFNAGPHGVIATLTGPRQPLTNRSILTACLRRPFGSRRVLALIHWQALRLWWKGAAFRNRPEPPPHEVSK